MSGHPSITVAARFNGPPDSGNGGYVGGLLAGRVGGDCAEVTVRRPIPLERPLAVVDRPVAGLRLEDGRDLVAQVRPAELELEVPAPPSFEAARAARERALGRPHVYPGCFVCGPARAEGDGLRVLAGRVDGTDVHAAPWVPTPDLADASGTVGLPFVWAALDCPGALALPHVGRPLLLGRMTARSFRRPQVGERCVAVGFAVGSEGRKHEAGTALFGADGALCGYSLQVWIEPRWSTGGRRTSLD